MVEEKKKVSIIIPVYNVEKYVSRCLDSITGQTYGNIEILINNDGSTDSSYEICKEYAQKDTRIKLFSQPNAGLSEARNAMFKHVTGDYVMFVDSDDYIALNTIDELLPFLEEKNADCISYGFRKTEEEKFEPFISNGHALTKNVSSISHVKHMLQPIGKKKLGCYAWNKIFKKEYLRYLKFPKGRLFEDVIAIPKLILKMRRVIEIDSVFYSYTIRKGSIIHSDNLLNRYTDELSAYISLYESLTEEEKHKIGRMVAFTFLYKYYCRKRDVKINNLNISYFDSNIKANKIRLIKALLLS